VCCFLFDPIQVDHKNRVEDQNQEQCDERCDGESADLGVAQGLPEGTATRRGIDNLWQSFFDVIASFA
jgi:hypothetical protein